MQIFVKQLLKNYHNHQDYNNSLRLLKNNKKHPLYDFFNNYRSKKWHLMFLILEIYKNLSRGKQYLF